MTGQRIISADSHVVEPPDLWQKNLPKRFKNQAPHPMDHPSGAGQLFVAEGLAPVPMAGTFAAGHTGRQGKSKADWDEHMKKGYDSAPPGAYDAVARMADQEVDGVAAEVLYPSLALPLFALKDAELQAACFDVYNDWLAAMIAPRPKRLYGVGLVSLHDIERATQSLHHLAERKMRGVMIWSSPPEGISYANRAFDPFWAAASELNMPVSLHVLSGYGRESVVPDMIHESVLYQWHAVTYHELQRSVVAFVVGGVLERFPNLKIVSVESDVGWTPHLMSRLDHTWEGTNRYDGSLPLRPSEYIKRQVYGTFQDDYSAPATINVHGADNCLWASDYPHNDSTWPDSRQWIDKHFAGVPDDVVRKVVFGNAAKLYGMELD